MHPMGGTSLPSDETLPTRGQEEKKIAYGVVHFFPGGTKEQYEAALAAVHPDRKTLPKGQLYHAAGPSAGGWTIIAIHDSKASWERFRDGILMPRFRQGVKEGFAAQPQEQAFEVYNLQP
jgi:hypothetical protein